MAANRKYAGLPDLDAAPEIYETPELTDDASTIQTSTLRTESPTPSDEGKPNEHFDRARLNQDEARRRFEPAVVSTKQTNLSDAIGGNRRGYTTTHRRRRRRIRRDNGHEEYGDLSDISSDEEETLGKKLARLRREAEEVRLELERRERDGEDVEFKDSVEQQKEGEQQQEEDKELLDGVEQLNRVLESLRVSNRTAKGETVEQELSRQLLPQKKEQAKGQQQNGVSKTIESGSIASPSTTMTTTTISAISAFSDRLAALENALGVSSISLESNTSSVLPTLDTLTSQITTLHSVINPKTTTSSSSSASQHTQRDHLDILTNRLHALHADADRMLSTRKAALQVLTQLHEARYSGVNHNSAAFAKYLSRREARERQRDSQNLEVDDAERNNNNSHNNNNDRSRSKSKDNRSSFGGASANGEIDIAVIEDRLFTDVFLEEQSSKITALYNTLPTIQNLQPLLPVVLDRLRGLSVVHASASTAQQDMNDVESRLKEWEDELRKWKDAVEGVERGIEESKVVMKENLDVVGDMVRALEGRMERLEMK